jgi:hypothetical protein|tara:strand:+ start:286 stop:594 length:309 start_codon:yes stop_codon:yes gene_type:complete
MVKYIKNKLRSFSNIFKDSNDLNEKNIVGFSSFAIMVIFAAADIITGLLGKELLISDTIFNSFVIVTLGSFGIDGVTKIFKKNDGGSNKNDGEINKNDGEIN